MKRTECRYPNKIAWTNRLKAQGHLFSLLNKKRDDNSVNLHTYKCGTHWHVGHAEIKGRAV